MKEIKKTSAYVVIDHSKGKDFDEVNFALFDNIGKAKERLSKWVAKVKEDLEVDKCADKDRFEIKEAPTQCLIYDYYTDTDVSIYIVERPIL